MIEIMKIIWIINNLRFTYVVMSENAHKEYFENVFTFE